MIPSLAEFLRSTTGAWRLAWLDPGGMAYFEISIPAFWRSFGLAILLAPLFVFLVLISPASEDPSAPHLIFSAGAVVLQALIYLLKWAAFPFVMIYVARFLGLGANYVAFIIARNWSTTIQFALLVPLTTISALAPLESGAGLLLLIAMVAIWFYQWFIARTALQISGGTAIAIVVLDFLIELTIDLSAIWVALALGLAVQGS